MSTLNLQSVVYHEGEHYVAQCLNVDVSSFGDTEADALANLQEALELYFVKAAALASVSRLIHLYLGFSSALRSSFFRSTSRRNPGMCTSSLSNGPTIPLDQVHDDTSLAHLGMSPSRAAGRRMSLLP
jgi:predicted RNase H-like HicB family nuclease